MKVISPIDDTPAAKAGLKPNDLITQVDGEPVQDLALGPAAGRGKSRQLAANPVSDQ